MKKTTPAHGTMQMGQVLDIRSARTLQPAREDLMKTYAAGELVETSKDSAYIVLTGKVGLIQSITTGQGPRSRKLREFGVGSLFNPSGLIGQRASVPMMFIVSEDAKIVEVRRDDIRKKSDLTLEVFLSLVQTLAKQSDEDHRQIVYLVTQKTREQADLEAKLENLFEQFQDSEEQRFDLVGENASLTDQLRRMQAALDAANGECNRLSAALVAAGQENAELEVRIAEQERQIAELAEYIHGEPARFEARLDNELATYKQGILEFMQAAEEHRQDAETSRREAATARAQQREAVEVFQGEIQHMTAGWKNVERFLSTKRLTNEEMRILLGISDETVTSPAGASSDEIDLAFDFDRPTIEDPVVDIGEILVVESLDDGPDTQPIDDADDVGRVTIPFLEPPPTPPYAPGMTESRTGVGRTAAYAVYVPPPAPAIPAQSGTRKK